MLVLQDPLNRMLSGAASWPCSPLGPRVPGLGEATIGSPGHGQKARSPFSRFLDEVTAQVLDPRTLEAFRGPSDRSPEAAPKKHFRGATEAGKTSTPSPQLPIQATSRGADWTEEVRESPPGPAASTWSLPAWVSHCPNLCPTGNGRGLGVLPP